MPEIIIAVSGGADSVYLVYRYRRSSSPLLLAHFNHRARGNESEKDREFVDDMSRSLGLPLEVGTADLRREMPGNGSWEETKRVSGFEKRARDARYDFLKKMKTRHGAKKILVAHTADDQVETILMRVLEGAGISGLKGIPRSTREGIERPLLSTWREDILRELNKKKIPYRVDRSNYDTRFERNWIRHVLLPLLEKRYGKSLKKRIHTLGERFREIDAYVEQNANMWLNKHVFIVSDQEGNGPIPFAVDEKVRGRGQAVPAKGERRQKRSPAKEVARGAVVFQRKTYSGLPAVIRMKILQILSFQRVGKSPNERLLASMDRTIISGGPSAKLSVGKSSLLQCRYGEVSLVPIEPGGRERRGKGRQGKIKEGEKGIARNRLRMEGPGRYRWKPSERADKGAGSGHPQAFIWVEKGKTSMGRIRRMAEDGFRAAFDAEVIESPLSVRPLRPGDRIRPFGLDADKKAKEILIDRKVPREERWGRPVVCDSNDVILWIPGVVRSAQARVTARTKRIVVLETQTTGRSGRGGTPAKEIGIYGVGSMSV